MATVMTGRDFNQDIAKAKRAASRGPVIVTDRGTPAHVLLTYAQYTALAGLDDDIVDLLGRPLGVEDCDFEPPVNRDQPTAAVFE
jgi:prevent-host-death family protein